MKFNSKEIKKAIEENYEKAWVETRDLLEIKGKKFKLEKIGKSHVVYDIIEKFRKTLINTGFEEVILPTIIEEAMVFKEYGPEAVLILDRLFYLASLPRPDIGISKKKLDAINEIIPNFNREDMLKGLFREYKIGKVEADDLIETMVTRLKIKEEQASEIIDKVFPELKDVKPIPSNLTLRSHTTALWFPVLGSMQKSRKMPIQLFHTGPKYRREQNLDKTHLYTSNTASLVIQAEEITLEDCQDIVKDILIKFGFEKVKFKIKKGTSKYYAPQTEFEVFIKHESGEWIEIGDGGFYSPVSLVKFGIDYPVFNFGAGIERLAMIQTGMDDIRKLAYPYYYDKEYSDEELAELVKIDHLPRSKFGLDMIKLITAEVIKCKDQTCGDNELEIPVWEGIFNEKNVRITSYEKDKGENILGKAALNIICVKNGDIIGVAEEEGCSTSIRYIDAIISRVVSELEEMIEKKETFRDIRIRMIKKPSDINIKIEQEARYYITSNEKKIDIRGPGFIGFRIYIKNESK
ncbi:MAG: O-phosphoserine--tRNA ligase [Candidatus Lokiarchaeota archaeon]|nr:O-phosphoserine--tRNA ligase [Candidatus Lokiarchaeota archaeon]